MEEAFKKLQNQGKNDVDSLVLWMKESKIIENSKEAEAKARSLFEGAANKQKVEFGKFKQALEKLAVQQKKSVEDLSKTLAEQGPKVLEQLQLGLQAGVNAGISAFQDAFKK